MRLRRGRRPVRSKEPSPTAAAGCCRGCSWRSRARAPRVVVASTTTDVKGSYRVQSLRGGKYVVRFALAGLHESRGAGRRRSRCDGDGAGGAADRTSQRDGAGRGAGAGARCRDARPRPSRSRTRCSPSCRPPRATTRTSSSARPASTRRCRIARGKGLNIATNPGTQADDASQSLNPSVNGARPTNNALRLNGIDVTNMLNGGGGLGSNVVIPLEALEGVEVQTALPSAREGPQRRRQHRAERSGPDRIAWPGRLASTSSTND